MNIREYLPEKNNWQTRHVCTPFWGIHWFLSCVKGVASVVSPQNMENGIPATRNSGYGISKYFPKDLFVLNGIMCPKRRWSCPYRTDLLCNFYIDSTSNKAHQHAVGVRNRRTWIRNKATYRYISWRLQHQSPCIGYWWI